LSSGEVIGRLMQAQTAFGSVNSVHDLMQHPQLQTRRMAVGERVVEVPTSPWTTGWEPDSFAPAPALDQHGKALRAEFDTDLVTV
jgi:itaconate CoA-transferase